MKADFEKWLKKTNRDAEGIRIGSIMPSGAKFELFNQFAEDFASEEKENFAWFILEHYPNFFISREKSIKELHDEYEWTKHKQNES